MSHKIEIYASVDGRPVHPPMIILANIEDPAWCHSYIVEAFRKYTDEVQMSTSPLFVTTSAN